MRWTVMEKWTNYTEQGPSSAVYSSSAGQVFWMPSAQQTATCLNPEPDKSSQGLHGTFQEQL
jgi:hypothetical protein